MNNLVKTKNKLVISKDDGYTRDHVRKEYENIAKIVFVVDNFDWGDFEFSSLEDYTRWLEGTNRNNVVTYPLFVYDHGSLYFGIDRDQYPFTCPWDTIHVGFIFITKAKWQNYEDKNLSPTDIIYQEIERLNAYYQEGWYDYYVQNEHGETVDNGCICLGLKELRDNIELFSPDYADQFEEAIANIVYF